MAKSKSIGNMFATLSLKDAAFRKGMKAAGASLAKFGTASLKVGAVAAGALTAGMIAGTKSTIEQGGALADLSAQTGVAVSDLMKIQQAYKDNGKDAGAAGKDINKMQKAIFDASKDMGGESDPFAAIGLSVEKLVAMNPSEQFFAIGGAINALGDPTREAAMAMKIFGKSGGSLLSVFKGSNLDDVNKSLGEMPRIMEQFADKLDRADDLIGRLPNKSNQFFAGFTAGIIDNVLPGLEKINETDFTGVGQRIGESLGANLSAAMNVFTSGKWWDIFVLEAELAFANIIKLPVIKQLAELMMFATGGGDGLTIDQVTDGYIGEINASIDALHEQIAQENQAKIDAAREKGKPAEKPMFAPSEEAQIPEIMPQIKVEIPPPPERQIDEYQRRGLAMSKNPGAVQDKVLKVQEQIRDILKAAKVEGKQLVWQ